MQTRLPFDAPEASTPRHTGVTRKGRAKPPKRPLRALWVFRGPFGLMIVESDSEVTHAPRGATRSAVMWTWDGRPVNENAPIAPATYGPHPGIQPDAR